MKNVRIFWLCVMERMCAWTRPRFIFSSEFVGNGVKPMLTPREKSPLPEIFSPEEDQTLKTASSRTASPTHYQRAIPAPCSLHVGPQHCQLDCFAWSRQLCVDVTVSAVNRAPIFPRFRGFPRKWSFKIREKKNPRKKIRPNLFLKRQLKLTQTAIKLQPRADDRILHLVFALQYEISRDQPVAIVFWVKMPRSDFVRRHEAAFRDFHIFLVGALCKSVILVDIL